MALHKLERRNYGRKSPVSIKYQNLHSFKERLIQSEYPWNKKNNTFTWLSSLYNPFKAALKLNNLYDTTCTIQLVWLCKIVNSYKFDVQIFVCYNFWKLGWVLFLPTCMKETDQSHFMFCNAELFWRKI